MSDNLIAQLERAKREEDRIIESAFEEGRRKAEYQKKSNNGLLTETDKLLEERGKRYGPFNGHAAITQGIKRVMRINSYEGWSRLSGAQREALEMIAHKIGRILNGDPNYDDSWKDIAGYAQLIVDIINGKNT